MPHDYTQIINILKESVTQYDYYQNDVMIFEFDSTTFDRVKNYIPLNPSRFDSLIFIGLTSGEMEIQVDYVTHCVKSNSIVFIMPTHITCFVKRDNHLKGWVLAISNSFSSSLSISKQQLPPVISYMQLKKNPLLLFEPAEYQSIHASLAELRSKVRKHTHLFHKEIIILAIKMFFLDMGNFYLGKKELYITPSLTRKEELFIDFQQLLLQFCTNQHEVMFYADKLCVTTQYLTSILKEQSGKSASQWIHEALIIEAKSLLKNPRINIQKVSDELNFPDQSTFGKFFKKHAGVSPMIFRKS